jgi:hypothetical protein
MPLDRTNRYFTPKVWVELSAATPPSLTLVLEGPLVLVPALTLRSATSPLALMLGEIPGLITPGTISTFVTSVSKHTSKLLSDSINVPIVEEGGIAS